MIKNPFFFLPLYIFFWSCYSKWKLWSCSAARATGARAHRKSTGEYYSSQARSFSARSFSSMLNKWLIQNLSYVQTWRRNDWYKTFPLTWSPSGRTSSFAMAICHHVIKKSNEKRILLKGKQLFSSRSHPKRSPTQNAFSVTKTAIFIKIAPIVKWLKKSNVKRILLRENSHFHQDRPHRSAARNSLCR